MSLKVAFHTFGCKLNQVETEAIADMFINEGYEISDRGEADIFFVNTCAVTHKAEAKGRRLLRKLAQRYPGRVIATGCLAQLKPSEIASLGEMRLVVGTSERFRILDFLRIEESTLIHVSGQPSGKFCDSAGNFFHSRSFIKIQDGCDHRCAYCVVPILRGDSVSLPASKVMEQAQKALQTPREIVLTGVDIGSYCDDRGMTLAGLLAELVKIPELIRLRLSSIEPPGFSPELIEICASYHKICPHFHLPLQSGSNKILKAMGRDYSAGEYLQLMHAIQDRIPGCRLGADVMVGFPGESDEDFLQSVNLVKEAGITHIHVFPFSPRPGTGFTQEDDTIHPQIKAKRAGYLRKYVADKNREYLKSQLGSVNTVFFEEGGCKGGFTDNYIRVIVPQEELTGFHQVKLIEISSGGNSVNGLLL